MHKEKPFRSFDELMVERLSTDTALTATCFKGAVELLNTYEAEDRAVALMTLRAIAQAHGGLTKVAKEAGIQRESLYRALSPKGNPTLRTLSAILKVTGAKLSIELPKLPKSSHLSTT